ncbi:hypothetical protein Cs7R123_06230 [Catellatospora sp. TT07R-123]|uniref:GAF and ANTAR domain-containing protein n=1 Tax=Catellatospora sp. TT07R-123 TaxID=2733863 RepID=UPI001B2D71AA|nr:GAF and ANTAR domain-containing protein [Catellatospora sp. TT07R-123]GHJ43281.1 hypothetical protein Cs7R123_06230 [Catellatospora sp. TT07R-123]
MTASAEANRALHKALARAEAERQRAERAADIAERHEGLLLTDPSLLREFHLKMATMHRQVQRLHDAAAAMHTSHANRLRVLTDTPERHHTLPRFMTSVAEAANADSAALTLFGPGLVETLTVVSDSTAKAAQDIEFTLGQGPARDTVAQRRAVTAAGNRLCHRWPSYGPAVQRLGIRSVAAVPVQLTGMPLGALTLFDPHRHDNLEGLRLVAQTVATMMLPDDDPNCADEDADPGALLAEADHRAVVHQATGVVSVQHATSIPDALALIRARAFAEDRPIESIASDIVEHRLWLA